MLTYFEECHLLGCYAVWPVRTDVSEKGIAPIIRATRLGELQTLPVTSNRSIVTMMMEVKRSSQRRFLRERHCVTSQKTESFTSHRRQNLTSFVPSNNIGDLCPSWFLCKGNYALRSLTSPTRSRNLHDRGLPRASHDTTLSYSRNASWRHLSAEH
jgi:hypothetical protein